MRPKPLILCFILLIAMGAVALIYSLRRTEVHEHAIGETDGSELGSVPSKLTRLETPNKKNEKSLHRKLLDPTTDNWPTEKLAELADKTLKKILASHDTINRWKPYVIPRLTCTQLVPTNLKSQIVGHTKFNIADSNSLKSLPMITSRNDFQKSLSKLVGSHGTHAKAPNVDVKTFGITHVSREHIATHHRIEWACKSEHSIVERQFHWRCKWQMGEAGLRLENVHLTHFQEAVSSKPRTWFDDDTASLFGRSSVYQNQLRFGLNHWLDRIPKTHGMYIFSEFGLAVGDVNGDGFDDVYVCQPGGLPNRLFLNAESGEAIDISAWAGVDWLDHTSSALLVDLDNDGDQDLAIAIEDRKILIMKNDGSAKFQLATSLPIDDRHVQGLSAVDYDNDGDLDVYVTIGFADERARTDEPKPEFIYHDANDGGANILFRSEISQGVWRFVDATKQVGLDANNRRHSLAASWEDFDNDGDQDLYIANDYGQNCLYRNDQGRFREIAELAGVVDHGSGMSVSWSDFDSDGVMDLYVGNMFSSAGNRIATQPRFQQHIDDDARHTIKRFAKGNTLFRNRGDGTFEDTGKQAGVELARWAWSSIFTDLNNDGFDDLFVANGYITNENPVDL